MKLEIRGHKLKLSSAMRQYIADRLEFAVGQFENRIHSLSVLLEDVNGPKGGVDKLCRIRVQMRRGQGVVIEDLADDVVVALDRAADRLRHTLGREVARRRMRQHQGPVRAMMA